MTQVTPNINNLRKILNALENYPNGLPFTKIINESKIRSSLVKKSLVFLININKVEKLKLSHELTHYKIKNTKNYKKDLEQIKMIVRDLK